MDRYDFEDFEDFEDEFEAFGREENEFDEKDFDNADKDDDYDDSHFIDPYPLDNWKDMAFLGAMAEEIGEESLARKQALREDAREYKSDYESDEPYSNRKTYYPCSEIKTSEIKRNDPATDHRVPDPHASTTNSHQSDSSPLSGLASLIILIVIISFFVRAC